MLVQGQQGYCEPAQFTFAGGAESEDINEFFRSLNLVAPWDYKEFLLRHNGARLFEHPHYGVALSYSAWTKSVGTMLVTIISA